MPVRRDAGSPIISPECSAAASWHLGAGRPRSVRILPPAGDRPLSVVPSWLAGCPAGQFAAGRGVACWARLSMSIPRAKSKRSCPAPEVSWVAYRLVWGIGASGRAPKRRTSSSWLRTQVASGSTFSAASNNPAASWSGAQRAAGYEGGGEWEGLDGRGVRAPAANRGFDQIERDPQRLRLVDRKRAGWGSPRSAGRPPRRRSARAPRVPSRARRTSARLLLGGAPPTASSAR